MRDRFNERYIAAIKADCMHECCMEGGFVKLSKADTFIEYCFEMACAHMNRGLDVLTEWRYRKDQYCKITDTIVYDFAHYSKHDSSHSVSILETIELVIGDERIVKLSRGDLWLLLESAYSHDIGMALTGEELYDLWSNPDFKEYLLFCLASKDPDLKKQQIITRKWMIYSAIELAGQREKMGSRMIFLKNVGQIKLLNM